MSRRRFWVPWLALAMTAFGALASFGALGDPSELALVRARAGAEPWRLWTGHFVHFNGAHIAADLVPFALWTVLVERESRRLLAWTLGLGTPLTSLACLLACPELTSYRGLSALDCALAAELIASRLVQPKTTPVVRAVALCAAALFAAKCGFELVTGHAVAARELGPGVKLLPAAHYVGAAIGCALALLLAAHPRRRAPAFSLSERPG